MDEVEGLVEGCKGLGCYEWIVECDCSILPFRMSDNAQVEVPVHVEKVALT